MILAIFLLASLQVALGDFVYPKCCPPIKPVKNIDWKKYAGVWLDQYHSDDGPYHCTWYEYKSVPGGYELFTEGKDHADKKFTMLSKMKFDTSTDPNAEGTYMDYEVCDTRDCGLGKFPDPMDIFSLGTDYTRFTVEYNCYCVGGLKKETVWIMYREKVKETPELKEAWMKILADNKITTKPTHYRENCPKDSKN